jgi:hypothetical protein
VEILSVGSCHGHGGPQSTHSTEKLLKVQAVFIHPANIHQTTVVPASFKVPKSKAIIRTDKDFFSWSLRSCGIRLHQSRLKSETYNKYIDGKWSGEKSSLEG